MNPDKVSPIEEVTIRFFVLGLLNTAVSFGLFIGLSFVMHPALAYSVAFVAVITVVAFASNPWVFRGQDSWPRRFSYLVCYLIIFLLAQVIIALTKPGNLFSLVVISGIVLSFTIPLTIVCGRWTFKSKAYRGSKADD